MPEKRGEEEAGAAPESEARVTWVLLGERPWVSVPVCLVCIMFSFALSVATLSEQCYCLKDSPMSLLPSLKPAREEGQHGMVFNKQPIKQNKTKQPFYFLHQKKTPHDCALADFTILSLSKGVFVGGLGFVYSNKTRQNKIKMHREIVGFGDLRNSCSGRICPGIDSFVVLTGVSSLSCSCLFSFSS